jgi:hypothetical protein
MPKPFPPEKSAELVLGEASRKITEMKKRQWDVTTNCLAIFGFFSRYLTRNPGSPNPVSL